jgi:hypothetical protein
VLSLPKYGDALARDFKWTGNHHHGFVHLGAGSHGQLLECAAQASALLGWPAPLSAPESEAVRAQAPDPDPAQAPRHAGAARQAA